MDTLTMMSVASSGKPACVYFSTSFLNDQMMTHFCSNSSAINTIALLGRSGLVVDRMVTFAAWPTPEKILQALKKFSSQGAEFAGFATRALDAGISPVHRAYLRRTMKCLPDPECIWALVYGTRSLALYHITNQILQEE